MLQMENIFVPQLRKSRGDVLFDTIATFTRQKTD